MIICFFISFPISVANLVFLPDMPWKAKPNWVFTEEELKLANTRLKKEGRAPAQRISLAKVIITSSRFIEWWC
jgi:MFS transporter, ACS family, pantothenate transporter